MLGELPDTAQIPPLALNTMAQKHSKYVEKVKMVNKNIFKAYTEKEALDYLVKNLAVSKKQTQKNSTPKRRKNLSYSTLN